MAFCLGCYFLGVGVGLGIVTEVFFVSLFQLESAFYDTTAKVAPLPFTVSGSSDPGLLHGFW